MTGTTATASSAATIEAIKQRAKRSSILSMMSTTAAGSGHPTSCMSAAELVAVTFFYAVNLIRKIPTRRMAIVSFCRKATPRRSFTPRSLKQAFSPNRV